MRRNSIEETLPDEATIRAVVLSFYSKVRQDELLAPVFEPRLADHWDEHMDTMVEFWSSVLLATGRYQGRPLRIHGALGELRPELWSRWLELFTASSREHTSEAIAAIWNQRAGQIAGHLSRTLAAQRGETVATQPVASRAPKDPPKPKLERIPECPFGPGTPPRAAQEA